MEQVIRIVYPRGDKRRLAFGIMFDYEANEWKIASRQSFPYTIDGQKAALEYAKELAKKYNLVLDTDNLDIDYKDYLD